MGWFQKSLFLGVFLCALSARAAEVSIKPMHLFVPMGFDDNDEITAVVDGLLPDPCHKLRKPEVTPVAGGVEIRVKAFVESGYCPDVTVPFTQVVTLGVMRAGKYQVRVTSTALEETLVVDTAKAPTVDDHLYAPVDAARIIVLPKGNARALLEGRFTSTCMRFKSAKALPPHQKTIVVLPIVEITERDPDGNRCQFKMVPFSEPVQLPPIRGGRYLLHVRTMNGQALNEVFTTEWNVRP